MNNSKSVIGNIISSLVGILFFAVGLINTFWGNDAGYGIFVLLLSLVYFPFADTILKKWTGYTFHPVLKILLGIFIIWSALGVGELFAKIDLMKRDLFTK